MHQIRKVGDAEREGREGVGHKNAEEGDDNSSANKILGERDWLVVFLLVFGCEEGEEHEGEAADNDPG